MIAVRSQNIPIATRSMSAEWTDAMSFRDLRGNRRIIKRSRSAKQNTSRSILSPENSEGEYCTRYYSCCCVFISHSFCRPQAVSAASPICESYSFDRSLLSRIFIIIAFPFSFSKLYSYTSGDLRVSSSSFIRMRQGYSEIIVGHFNRTSVCIF